MIKQWLIWLLFFVGFQSVLKAQNSINPDSVYTVVEQMPQPVGGYAKFYKYLDENIYYTQQAIDKKIEGYVFVQFVVDKTGRLENIKIVKGLGFGLDEEVIRVFEESPKWTIGKEKNIPVRVRMTFSVIFRLPR
ncbi:MAG: energy transducer TonB [Raineya sp.]|jgi:protein TonB|nr:energy transducer TonB [Raineya sp.]